jgi:glycine cleavage system H protein
MNKILKNLQYAESHEWIERLNDTTVRIGISDFAQQALGDIVFINLPEIGDAVTAGQAFGDIESVKTVSDLTSPVTGTVTAVYQDVIDQPELINENPYENWLIKVTNLTAKSDMMAADEYEEFCSKEVH